MGTEYRIRYEGQLNRERLDARLRSMPNFARFVTSLASYEFRHPENPGKMPDVAVTVEEEQSLYVCAYGGEPMASQVIGALMLYVVHELENAVSLRLLE